MLMENFIFTVVEMQQTIKLTTLVSVTMTTMDRG